MDRKKRILIFSLAYFPDVGGAEIAIKEITDRLPEFEFDLISKRFNTTSKSSEKIGNVYVHRIDSSKVFFPVNAYLFARKLHKKNKYDGIWGMMAAHAGAAAMFFKYSFPKVPYVLTLQEGVPLEYIKKLMRPISPLFKKIFLKADVIQVISNFLGDFARSMGYQGAIVVVPNGVDAKLFGSVSAPDKMAKLEERLMKKEGDVMLVTTSRLVEKNAIDDVLKALPLLPSNVKFLIVGTGPDEAALKNLAKNLKLEGRVKFAGYVKYEDVPLYLHASDIFIRPSLSEGMGNSFIEAMAAGLPVIATPVGGIVDFLFDPEKNPELLPTGLYAEVRNPQSIARQVKKLMEDKILKDEIVASGKMLATKKYDWNLIAKIMKTKVFNCF